MELEAAEVELALARPLFQESEQIEAFPASRLQSLVSKIERLYEEKSHTVAVAGVLSPVAQTDAGARLSKLAGVGQQTASALIG